MLLRSGTFKELIAKCYVCNEFYGNKKYKYKCSVCYGGVNMHSYPWRDEEFRNRVNEWAGKKITISNVAGGLRTLKQIVRRAYDGTQGRLYRFAICKDLITKIQQHYKEHEMEFYISAKEGEELLKRTGQEYPEKFHLICPLVLDWWNMKNYSYSAAALCYYGHFGDEMAFCQKIKSIPPPPPHECMI